ncbi:MAG TPA: hypothetical protein VFZ59_18495 [Verrucomicrobiae bacterium]|nr:hypothetical protein [Verrucomicrobiae bacterium]
MKTCAAFAFIGGFLAVHALGQGSAVMIKNRAKETVNQNNVRQGVPPPSTPPPGSPPAQGKPAAPAATGVSPTQSIAKLKADLVNFKTGSPATAEQKQQFIKDLAVAARSGKPSLPTVTKFVDSLTIGLSEVSLTEDQQGRLARNIDAVLNSKPLPAAQFDAIIADVQAIMQVGSLKRTSAVNIAKDLKAVGAEVRR